MIPFLTFLFVPGVFFSHARAVSESEPVTSAPRVGEIQGTRSEGTREALVVELQRLRESWSKIGSGAGEMAARCKREIELAADALEFGPWSSALEPFSNAFLEVHEVAFLRETSVAGEGEVGAFEQLWREQERAIEGLAPVDAARHAALAAFEERATAYARRYYPAALSYAHATGVKAGRAYLARARANAELAGVLRSLPAEHGTSGRVAELAIPGLGRCLEKLERELAARFRPPVSRTQHREFIEISSGLEFARELALVGARRAALVQALEARQAVALLDGEQRSVELDELEAELETYEERLEEAGRDDSIATIFVDRAARALHEAATGSRAAERVARALLEDVLPEYFLAVEDGATVGVASADRAEVTVTLVRWPFT